MTYLGDYTIGHPNAPSRIPDHPSPAVPLQAAHQLAANKRSKVRRFLRALRAESGFVPPSAEKFVPLAAETYGAASEELVALFNSFASRWKEIHHASEYRVAISRHQWRYRIPTAIQARNAELLSQGLLKWACRN